MSDTPQRSAEEIQAEIDKLSDTFDAEDINVSEFKTKLRALNTELADAKNAKHMYDTQLKIAVERNRRVFDEIARKNYNVTIAEADKMENGGGVPFKYFKANILANGAALNQASAQGDEALREWLESVAEVVNKETGHDPEAKDKPKAKPKPKPKPEPDDDEDQDNPVEDPEPTDITDIPEDTDQSVDEDKKTPGEEAFLRLIAGNEISELEQAMIARDLVFNESSFRDPGLPEHQQADHNNKRINNQ